MTYTIFEWVKENRASLVEAQPERVVANERKELSPEEDDKTLLNSPAKKVEKLTKSQKRKLAGRQVHGELPRGHDWVDVIKHLFQGQPQPQTAS